MANSTHSGRLERWLGKDKLESLSASMADWYGPPIAVAGVPGSVFIHKGGDFRGEIRDGFEMSVLDRAADCARRLKRAARVASARNRAQLNAGFTSLSDLISEATSGSKQREFMYQKVGVTGVIAATSTLWTAAGHPVAGSVSSAAPGGRAPTKATTGAIAYNNSTGGDTMHVVSSAFMGTATGNQLLFYDRIFDVVKTMSSTATEAVTGVPTRYQSAVTTADDYAGGNFVFPEIVSLLGGTAHNWTVCTYTDQDGNTGANLPSVTGLSAGIASRLDIPTGQWFCPLATGDFGIRNLTQMQCSASVTGAVTFVIGHPLFFQPCPLANVLSFVDNINTAFNLTRIFDNACISALEITKSVTTATTYSGKFYTVSG